MGCQIRAPNRRASSKEETPGDYLVANAFSGHCEAIPCQVRDETYVKVRGKWHYLYLALDRDGKTLDFMLSKRRNEPAATVFFAKTLSSNGLPEKIVIDKSGANTAGIRGVNKILKRFSSPVQITTIRSKYLNHRTAG